MNKPLLTSPPPPIDKVEHFIPEQTFRLRLLPISIEGLMKNVPDQRDMDGLIEQFPSNET